MTRINCHSLVASPCCKTLYCTPRYASLNLMAFGYWTDGKAEQAITAMGSGFRKCQCGAFYLMRDTIKPA